MSTNFSLTNGMKEKFWSQPGQLWYELIRDAPRFKGREQDIRLVERPDSVKITMPCFNPAHNDKRASAAVHLDKGFANCLGGSCHAYTSDPAVFVQLLYNLDYERAAKALCTKFKLKMPKEQAEGLGNYERMQRMIGALHAAAQDTLLHVAANATDPTNILFLPALNYIHSKNMSPTWLASAGVGLFPRFRAFYSMLPSEDQPFALEFFGDYVFPKANPDATGPYTGWLVFAYEFGIGQYGKFKLRNGDQNSQKFKSEAWLGPDTKNNFFGLSRFSTVYAQSQGGGPNFDMNVVEGEFDALGLMHYQEHVVGGLVKPVVSASGGGVGDVANLVTTGASRIVLLPDHDTGGVGFVENSMKSTDNSDVLSVYEYDSTPFVAGSDPYDLIMGGNAQDQLAFYSTLDIASPHIVLAHEWLTNRFNDAWHQLISPTPQEQMDTVKRYARLLPSGVGAEKFLDEAAKTSGLPKTSIRAHALNKATDERSFRSLLELRLAEEFEVLLNTGTTLQCYSRRAKVTFMLPLSRATECCQSISANAVRRPLLEWVEDVMGLPTFIAEKRGPKGTEKRPYGEQLDIVRQHVFAVVTDQIIAKAPVQEQVQVLKQGVHAIKPEGFSQFSGDAIPFIHGHIINGHLHFRGKIEPGKRGAVYWRAFDNAKPYADSVFVIGGDKAWSTTLTDEDSINIAIPEEVGRENFDRLVEMFDMGWTFEEQEVVPQLLAAFVMTSIIHQFADTCPMFHFTGKTQAGKSTMVGGVFRGEIFDKRLWLIEHCSGIDAYTPAAVWQAIEGNSRLMILDEFEDSDDGRYSSKSAAVAQIYEDLRNVATGMELTRGGANGVSKTYHLRTGILTAGIHPIKREVDANRYLTIRLVRQPHVTPAGLLQPVFSAEEIRQLRKNATLFALQHANGILGRYIDLKANLKSKLTVYEDRALQLLYLPLALMDYLGHDPVPMAQALLSMHERNLHETVLSEEDALFDAIFDTPVVDMGDDMRTRLSLRAVLANTQSRGQLNTGSDYGVYLDESAGMLYMHLPSVHRNVLRYNDVYRKTENALTLHARLTGHPLVKRVSNWKKDPAIIALLKGRVDTSSRSKANILSVDLNHFL